MRQMMVSLIALACSRDAEMTMPGTRTSVEMCADVSSRSGTGFNANCSPATESAANAPAKASTGRICNQTGHPHRHGGRRRRCQEAAPVRWRSSWQRKQQQRRCRYQQVRYREGGGLGSGGLAVRNELIRHCCKELVGEGLVKRGEVLELNVEAKSLQVEVVLQLVAVDERVATAKLAHEALKAVLPETAVLVLNRLDEAQAMWSL
jgi:hypothetical protein